jgi:ComF family protein
MRYIQPVNEMQKALLKRICFENLLKRTRYTAYQSKLSKAERAKNIKGVFETRANLKGKKILLVDDILTTGSTLREAAKTLKKAGADRVDIYTLFARRSA